MSSEQPDSAMRSDDAPVGQVARKLYFQAVYISGELTLPRKPVSTVTGIRVSSIDGDFSMAVRRLALTSEDEPLVASSVVVHSTRGEGK